MAVLSPFAHIDELVAFADADAPQSLVVTRITSYSISWFLFLVNTYYLIKVSIARRTTTRAKHKHVMNLLIGQLAFTALTCAWAAGVAMLEGSVEACFHYASVGAFTYCMSFTFSYLVLLNRAKVVNAWAQTKCFNAVHASVTRAVYGMGLASIGAYFCNYGKSYFKEQYCAQLPISTVIPWIVVIMDSLLSFVLFAMFAGPMLARLKASQTKSMELEAHEDDAGTTLLKKTARKNFWLSTVQISSTFICLMIVFVAEEVVNGSSDPELQVLNMVTLFVGPVDTSINTACSLAMVQKVWRRSSSIQPSSRSRRSVGSKNKKIRASSSQK